MISLRAGRLGATAALAALATLAATLSAQQPAPAFRFERPVLPAGSGPQRLAIDVPLLTGGKPFRIVQRARAGAGEGTATGADGLGDLRLFDAEGREVPHLLVLNPLAEPTWRSVSAILPVAPVETDTARTSGFEADLSALVRIDHFRIERLTPPFLKRVRLEASGDRQRWTLLVGEGTLFDLPDERLQQLELGFEPGSYRYLRVTWDDAMSARVQQPQSVSVRETTAVMARPPLTATLAFERRPSEPRRSSHRIRLPAGRLPIVALDLDVGAGHVMRNATVSEARLTGVDVAPFAIGRTTLRRVEQGSLTASSLSVPVSAPNETELDLEIDDGDNPPLELRSVTAIFAELPWIYFEASSGTLSARYGDARLAAPKYDLEAVRQTLRVDGVPTASWGEARTRTTEGPAEAAPTMTTVGSVVDASRFRYVRTIAPAADAGLVALRLDAPVLAHSAGAQRRFGDVRVVDGGNRQVPYLLERASEPLVMEVSLETLSSPPAALPPATGARSVYRARWALADLPAPRLVLATNARVFSRRISIAVEREPTRERRDPWIDIVGTGNWVHASQATPASPLTIQLPRLATQEVLVLVEEGDNTPLPIETAQILLPTYRLRFFRDADTPLRLAYGDDQLTAPQYDLALLAPHVMGVSATEIVAEPEGDQSATAETAAALLSPLLFWVVLGIAVVVLLVLIARLLRKESAGSSP